MFTTQPIGASGEISLEGLEIESQLFVDSELPEAKGEMQSGGKTYTLTHKNSTESTQTLQTYIQESGPKNTIKAPDFSPMRLATLTYQQNTTSPPPIQQPKENEKSPSPSKAPVKEKVSQQQTTTTPPQKVLSEPIARATKTEGGRVHPRTEKGEREQRENKSTSLLLQSRSWSKEETSQWWEERYHQKEREGEKQRDHQEQQEEGKKKDCVDAIASTSTSKRSHEAVYRGQRGDRVMKKPVLQRPRTGIFALYYILTKIGIFSDGTSNFSYKKEIETLNEETTRAHKKRLEELKIAIDKEASASRWGMAAQVFSWIGSLMGIITGIALIATGVGAIAGAMLIAGGVIQLTNQILEISGGWKKISELLPGNDPEKKRAVISWMQIGIAVLCLILSGVGIIWGGFAQLGDTSQATMSALSGIAAMGHGVTTIGEGITVFMFKDKMGEVKRYDKILAELKHKRQDLMERVDWGIDRLEQLFEDLAKTLEFEVELFRADQIVNR